MRIARTFPSAFFALFAALAPVAHTQSKPAAELDFEYFKTRVQPLFLTKRPGHARCYVCHSTATTFRLERLSPGASSWNDEQSRRNFAATVRLVVPGDWQASRLLTHPLTPEAGGDPFHSGGKHWDSRDNPEWKILAGWVNGQKAASR